MNTSRRLWRAARLAITAALAYALFATLTRNPYRIDVDVYRMGGRAWLDGQPLYAGDARFTTEVGLPLPFTYPPPAAIGFAPLAWLSLPVASAVIVCVTLAALVVTIGLLLADLDVWSRPTARPGRGAPGPAWARRGWLAAAVVAPAVTMFEPIRSNFEFGQVNAVLMALVVADCTPRRVRWPRGVLVGLAVAVKLTPAVFLLYFLLRRDLRAAATGAATFLAVTAGGFALAWQDSWRYWRHTLRDTSRIGDVTLNTDQNLAAVLGRLDLTGAQQALLWRGGCVVILILTLWAGRRALAADAAERFGGASAALVCVALFGLVVSPVSWSHHWVWMLPAVLVTGTLAIRCSSLLLGLVSAAGVALQVWTPVTLLPEHAESTAAVWRQMAGAGYVWWALTTIVVIGVAVRRPPRDQLAAVSGMRAGGEPRSP